MRSAARRLDLHGRFGSVIDGKVVSRKKKITLARE